MSTHRSGHHAVRCSLLQNSPQRWSRRSVTLRKTGTQTVSRTGGTRFVVSAEVLQEVLGIDGGRFAWPRKKGFSLRSACPACRAVAYSRRRERRRRDPSDKATLSGGIRQTDRQTDRRKSRAKWPRFAISYTKSEQGLRRFHLPPPKGGGTHQFLNTGNYLLFSDTHCQQNALFFSAVLLWGRPLAAHLHRRQVPCARLYASPPRSPQSRLARGLLRHARCDYEGWESRPPSDTWGDDSKESALLAEQPI